MHVAIVGAGFTGIAAAWRLAKQGHQVTIFERAVYPGGLAAGFEDKQWKWSLEHHYHHIFTSDKEILSLMKAMGLQDLAIFSETRTAIRRNGSQDALDSPWSLLAYSQLSLLSRMRTGLVILLLKLLPMWKFLERFTAKRFLIATMGRQAWEVLWEPLFIGKFGDYASDVNAAWFWARIHVRSQRLGYFTGGFGALAVKMAEKLESLGVTIIYDSEIIALEKMRGSVEIKIKHSGSQKTRQFDSVLVSAPAPILLQLSQTWSKTYQESLTQLKGLAAQTLILELDAPFFKDKTYWMNINEYEWPFLAVVEHTNFVSSEYYSGKHIVYVGNYLSQHEETYQFSKAKLLKHYDYHLKKLSPTYADHVTRSWLFRASFAQPVPLVSHSKQVPSMKTEIPGVYWASMQHVYPWDRGTNYAVKLGNDVADLILSEFGQ